MADVTGPVLVRGAASPAPDAVDVLVALGGVLGEVDPGPEHSADVGMALIEALVDYGVNEGRPWGSTASITLLPGTRWRPATKLNRK